MEHRDRDAIDGLFDKLAEVEQRTPPRDGDAEGYIRQRLAQQPAAPYYMAQTIVVQEQALEAAQRRIMELEAQPRGGGGFLSSLFGAAPQRPQPPARYGQQNYGNQGYQQRGPWGGGGGGGGFLAGAAQTALGVAGGVLIANAITGAFAGGESDSGGDSGDAGGSDDGGGFDGGDAGGGDF